MNSLRKIESYAQEDLSRAGDTRDMLIRIHLADQIIMSILSGATSASLVTAADAYFHLYHWEGGK
jgi:hypothetical protein